MTAPSNQAVLQLVILRDGLLVGTEVLVPGTYTLGASRDAEVHLDDAQVDPLHALLYFQNGRTAIQDNGSRGGVYVNGHQVRACEIRSQDEVLVGPFLLKTRVLSQRPLAKPPPPPEVAALLNRPATVPSMPGPSMGAPPAPIQLRPSGPPSPSGATVPSARRAALSAVPPLPAAAPQARPAPLGTVPSSRMSALAAVPLAQEADLPTESVPLPDDLLEETAVTSPGGIPYGQQVTQPGPVALPPEALGPTSPGVAPGAPTEVATPAAVTADTAPEVPATAAKAKPRAAPVGGPSVGVELYWGEIRKEARTFRQLPKEGVVHGAHADDAAVPMWGFSLPEERFALLDAAPGGGYRVFIPPGAAVERRLSPQAAFMPVTARALEADGSRRFLTLREGTAARLTEGELSLVASCAAPPAKASRQPAAGPALAGAGLFFLVRRRLRRLLVFGPQPRDARTSCRGTCPRAACASSPRSRRRRRRRRRSSPSSRARRRRRRSEKAAAAAKKPERAPPRPKDAPRPARVQGAQGAGEAVRRRPRQPRTCSRRWTSWAAARAART